MSYVPTAPYNPTMPRSILALSYIAYVVLAAILYATVVTRVTGTIPPPAPTCYAVALESQKPGSLIVTGRATRWCAPAPVQTN